MYLHNLVSHNMKISFQQNLTSDQCFKTKRILVFIVSKLKTLEDEGFPYVEKMAIYQIFKW